MNEEINDFQKENSYELKIDLSPQDLDEKITILNKRVKRYKIRRFQIILIGILIAVIVFLILSAPNIVAYRYGYYPFTATVAFFVIISLGLSVAFFAAVIFQSMITSLESSLEELQTRQRIASQLDEGRSFRISVGEGSTVNLTPSVGNVLDLSPASSSYFLKSL